MHDDERNMITPDSDEVEIIPDTEPDMLRTSAPQIVSEHDFSSHYRSVYEAPSEQAENSARKSAEAAEKYRNSVLIASAQKSSKRLENKNKIIFTAVICLLCTLLGCLSGALSARITVNRAIKNQTEQVAPLPVVVTTDIPTSAPLTVTTTASESTGVSETTSSEESTVKVTQPIPSAVASTNAAVAKTANEIYRESVDSVVGISAKIKMTNSFFGQSFSATSSGSGFIVTKDGYILTNYHVVEGGSDITVSFYDESTLPATLVGYDKDNDIAVLKTDRTDLHAVKLGDSAKLSVGDTVLVIGNPLSLSYSLSSGVVSALNRTLSDEGTQINMFQTDAAINAGNSGGPAFNMDGEVVGIATSKYADSTIEGLSFCIPIDDIKKIASDIMMFGYVRDKAMLSVSGQTLNASTASRYNLVEGVYIVALGSGGAAERAGIQKGDVITALNGNASKSVPQLKTLLKSCKAGETITLTVYRSGSAMEINVTVDMYADAPARTNYSNVFDF